MHSSPVSHTPRALVLVVFAGAFFSHAAIAAPQVDPAALVTKEEVAALVGAPVVEVVPAAPEKDDDLGGTLGQCTYRTESCMVVVSDIAFPSGIEARAKFSKEFVAGLAGDEKPRIEAEAGIGEGAFCAITENGIQFVVLKGAHVVGVGFGGKPPKPLASYRDALRTLTRSALVKLEEKLTPKPQDRPPPDLDSDL